MKKRTSKKAKNRCCIDVWSVAMTYLHDSSAYLLPDHYSFILGLIRAREYEKLAQVRSLLQFEYHTAQPNKVLFQIEALFKKNTAFGDDKTRLANAVSSFNAAEKQCEETNARLGAFWHHENYTDAPLNKTLTGQIKRMRNMIWDTMGSPVEFLETLHERLKVTGGATSTRNRKNSRPHLKMRKRIPCTSRALPYLMAVTKKYCRDADFSRLFSVIEFNRVEFVDKNFKTFRGIAAESEGNVVLQLALDDYMKERMILKFSLDLKDQQPNAAFAWYGSLPGGDIATVDMTQASDTTAHNAIPFLFSADWSRILCDFRSPAYQGMVEGEYHKFSSMGNGTTFPIETLLFYTAARAVGSDARYTRAYGDDLIIEAKYYDSVVSLLSFIGFTVNAGKTFHKGPFRESCGSDYWEGTDVRAFYVKTHGTLKKHELCHLINGLAQRALPGGKLAYYLRSLVEKQALPLVPISENTREGIHVTSSTMQDLSLFLKPIRNKVQYYTRLTQVPGTDTQFVIKGRAETWRKKGNLKPHQCFWQEEDRLSTYYLGYMEKERIARQSSMTDLKCLILWLFTKTNLKKRAIDLITSKVGTADTYVVRGRLQWVIPIKAELHHYWWSSYLVRA